MYSSLALLVVYYLNEDSAWVVVVGMFINSACMHMCLVLHALLCVYNAV